MKTKNSQKLFSVSITHNSKIRELSNGNRVIEIELSFAKQPFYYGSYHFWVMSYENRELSYQKRQSKWSFNFLLSNKKFRIQISFTPKYNWFHIYIYIYIYVCACQYVSNNWMWNLDPWIFYYLFYHFFFFPPLHADRSLFFQVPTIYWALFEANPNGITYAMTQLEGDKIKENKTIMRTRWRNACM